MVEGTGKVILTVVKDKDLEGDFKFRVRTQDGTAKDIHDYKAMNKEFTMKALDKELEICIEIRCHVLCGQEHCFRAVLISLLSPALADQSRL